MEKNKKVEKYNSFEINLVPDIKGEVLKKRRIQALVIACCVAVGGGCALVLASLFSTLGVQALQLGVVDNEIACRADGNGTNCKNYGVAVSKTENVNSLLTIKDQMDNIGELNANKIRFSRLFGEFGILDALLMKDSDEQGKAPIKISDLSAEFADTVNLSFSAEAIDVRNNISYTTVERFKKNASEIYYDSGRYMRKNTEGEGEEYVEIPSFCIIKEKVDENGLIYGLYVKGIPGCEMPMVRETDDSSEEMIDEEERERRKLHDVYALNGLINPDTICDHTDANGNSDVTCVWIRRTYVDNKDLSEYKNGYDMIKKDEDEAKGMYYFQSDCLVYSTEGDGKFNEAETLEKCKLLDDFEVSDASQTKDEETGQMTASFTVTANVTKNVFLDTTKFMKVFGPSRRNVTDSYAQIREMYTEKEEGAE